MIFILAMKIISFCVLSQTCLSLSADSGLQEVLDEHKISLRRRCESVTEGTDATGSGTLLNRIYTELYITEGQSEEVNTQHEVMQLETASKKKTLHDTPIKCHDIFKALPDQQGHIRVVLTNGVAGIGKTFSVQKFTLDWAEGLENQDVSLVILPFVQGAELDQRWAVQSSHAAPCFASNITEGHSREARWL